jgi:ABC-type phosphate/phosphonate transport system substrate-binding protein
MKRYISISTHFIFLLALLTTPLYAHAAEALDFVIIQPGAPGSTAEAAPVMEALAAYLQKKVGAPVQGQFFNENEPALAYLGQKKAKWGIVSLGFYLSNAQQNKMSPFASTRPNGLNKDTWHLLVNRDAGNDWKTLNGTVSSSLLFNPDPVAHWTFGKPAAELPFTLKATPNTLQALRNVARGKAAGVILDQVQLDTLKSLDIFKQLKILHSSQALPTSPVVWFGAHDAYTEKIHAALLHMADDIDAKSLLELLRTQGFAAADPTLTNMTTSTTNTPASKTENKAGKHNAQP